MKMQRRLLISAALMASFAVALPAQAGILGPIFVNENLTILVPPNATLIQIIKVLRLVGDPPSVDTSIFYNNFYDPPNTNLLGQPTVTTDPSNHALTDVLYATGDGFPAILAPPHPCAARRTIR